MQKPNPNKNAKVLLALQKCCNQAKLRPEIFIDADLSQYNLLEHLKNDPNNHKHFFGVHFYWDEKYFDTLQMDPKIKTLQNLVEAELQNIPNYSSREWGASDGHLFCYITLTI